MLQSSPSFLETDIQPVKVLKAQSEPNFKFQTPVTMHAVEDPWIVLGFTSGQLLIYNLRDVPPRLSAELDGHRGYISGIDIMKGRIVSVSHDRSIYVWEPDCDSSTGWRKTVVALGNSHSLLCVKWDHTGSRFCAGVTGTFHTIICTKKSTSNQWKTRRFKKHDGPVTSVSWSVHGYLASGGQDRRVIIYGTKFPDVDKDNISERNLGNAIIADVDVGAWVNCIEFSPNGKLCAACSHNRLVTLLHLDGETLVRKEKIVCNDLLPFASLTFLNDRRIVSGGWNFEPVILQNEKKKDRENDEKSTLNSRWTRSIVVSLPSTSRQSVASSPDKVQKRVCHENTITHCHRLTRDRFTTTGIDGRCIVWSIG